MALKPFNSVAGFSIGEVPAVNIILANGDITASNATFTGNLLISNANANWGVLTDNLYYSNGVAWDLGGNPAGSNNYIQYNIDGEFAASANFTFDPATNLLTVVGNIDVANADLGNLVVANFANIASNTLTNNLSVNLALSGNTANFTGSLTAANANLGNLATANFVNVSSNTITSNAVVNLELSGNTATFIGNISAANANLGNLVTANFANIASNVNANNIAASSLITATTINASSTITTQNLTVNVELSGNTANFSGNVAFLNANLGNLATANFVNVSSNLNAGNVVASTLTSNVATGTAPLTVSSTTKVTNLNADLLDGYDTSTTATANTVAVRNADGNLTANYFIGNGSQLTGIDATSIQNGNSNVKVAANGNVSISVAGTSNVVVVTDTGMNVAGYINATGNLTSANADLGNLVTANFINVSSNIVSNNATVNLELQANTANFDGNVVMDNWLTVANTANVGNLRTDNLLYANGAPWDMQEAAGANYEIQFNINDNFAASANLTYNDGTQQFTVLGNGQFNNANLGNIATANFVNVASNTTTSNLTVNLELAGNTANFTGNVIVPNLTVNTTLSGNVGNFTGNLTAANGNLGNLVIANFVQTGTVLNGNSNVVINANGNVVITATSNSTITISDVGANITGYVTANGDGTFGAVNSNTVTAQGGNLTLYAATGNNYIELRPTGNGQVDLGNFRIQNLADPVNAQDAATKLYVDNIAEGLHIHASVAAVTPDTLANITAGTITYNNGSSGVGATLVTTGTYTLIDGVNVATAGTRILVKDEANTAHNGIYTYTNSTTLTRATDFDTSAEIQGGDFVFSTGGTLYNSTGWVQVDNITTVGTDPIIWDQFSGAGTYTAGSGLTLTGTVFSVNVDNVTTEIAGGNVVVKANAQFTTPNIDAATGTSLSVTGNIVAGNIAANSKITTLDLDATSNILANNISANANLTVNNATINLALGGNTANFSGNLTAANANLGNLATANFFTGVLVNGTSNVKVNSNGNIDLTAGANTTAVITATGANITGYANITGNVSANNLSLTNNISANIANIATRVDLGNTDIGWDTTTTTSISANQTISTFAVTGVTGVEFLVKGIDSSGSKYSVSTVQAVTDGSNVDYTTFATVNLGGLTGILAVNIVGSNIALQVSPTSTNSTVWTTQYRTI